MEISILILLPAPDTMGRKEVIFHYIDCGLGRWESLLQPEGPQATMSVLSKEEKSGIISKRTQKGYNSGSNQIFAYILGLLLKGKHWPLIYRIKLTGYYWAVIKSSQTFRVSGIHLK